jgi:transcription elongation GreA/GreB family factor
MSRQAIDKRALVAELKEKIAAEIARHTKRAKDAAEAATHEENKPEGDKDMRSTEASYIARGQAERVREMETALAKLSSMAVLDFGATDRIGASALVELKGSGAKGTSTYFLVTAGGGEQLEEGGGKIATLATTSPLGKALLGLLEGEDAQLATAQGERSFEIVSVR